MYRFESRREQHAEKIAAFLADTSRQSMKLLLYNREIKALGQQHPEISIQKGDPYSDNAALFHCIVCKR